MDYIADQASEMLKLAKQSNYETLSYLFAMVAEESASLKMELRRSGAKTAFEAIESGAVDKIAEKRGVVGPGHYQRRRRRIAVVPNPAG